MRTLTILRQPGVFDDLLARTEQLCTGIGEAASASGVPVTQTRVGTMFSTFFAPDPVSNWATVSQSDTSKFGLFFQSMLEQGIYLAPSQFEAGFTSTAHTEEIVETTVAAARAAFQQVAGQ